MLHLVVDTILMVSICVVIPGFSKWLAVLLANFRFQYDGVDTRLSKVDSWLIYEK